MSRMKKHSSGVSKKLFTLNMMSLQYAKFENELEPMDYEKMKGTERTEYKLYCILWFNLLSDIFSSTDPIPYDKNTHDFDRDLERCNKLVYVPEVIHQHKSWWYCDPVNAVAYSDAFRDFVDFVIKSK